MKRNFNILYSIALVGLMGSLALAIQDPAPDPNNGSGWGVTAGEINNIQCQNASTGPGNPSGTYYWFAASDSQSNPSYPNTGIGPVAPGHTEIGGASGVSAGGGDTEIIAGNTINDVLANHSYRIYAQACPNLVNYNGTGCSNWILINSNAVTTVNLPPTPIVGPATTDVTTNSETLHTNSSSVPDPENVQYWNIGLNNVQSGSSQVFAQTLHSYSSSNQQITIGPSGGYNFTLLPNNRYQSISQVDYFWSQPTAVPAQTENFTTTPVQPGPATVPNPNITHCSAEIIVENSNGLPANPIYTNYQVCLNGGAGCLSQMIGGSGLPTDTTTYIFSNLNAGQTYGGNSQALNEDGAWNNSITNTVPGFTTLSWGSPTPSMSAITINSATYNLTGVTGGSTLASYQLQTSPDGSNWSNYGSQTAWPSGASSVSVSLSSLSSNTRYYVRIILYETGSCNNTLGETNFYTLPVAPTAPDGFGTVTSNSIQANWTDGSSNGLGTTYHMQYCSNFAGSSCNVAWTDFGTNPAKSGTSESGTITGLTSFTNYLVQVKTVGLGGTDSSYLVIGSTQTQDTSVNMSAITFTVFPSSISLSVTASGGIGPYQYHWSVLPTAGTSFTANDGVSAGANNTTMNYSTLTSYTVTVTATDNSGSGPGVGTQTQVINPGQVPSTMDPIQAPGGTTIVVGPTFGKSFNVIVRNQFGAAINNQAVTWSLNNGAASLSPAVSSFTVVTGVNSTLSPVTLTASINGIQQTISITVVASGPQFTTNPTIILNSATTGNLSAAGIDNSPGAGSMNYNWTLESGPSPLKSVVPNNSTSANNAVVTFSAAGTYVLRCTITDNFASDFADTPSTTVAQVLTSIKVCAATDMSCAQLITLQTLQNEPFTASGFDQFGIAVPPLSNVKWTSSGGTVAGSGATVNFNDSSIGQGVLVTATDPVTGRKGSITVDLVSFDVSNAYAYPVPYKANTGTGVIHFTGLGSQASLHIYTTSGRRVFDISLTSNTYDWPIKNSSGESVASGVYFYVIQSSEGKKNGKLIIIQ